MTIRPTTRPGLVVQAKLVGPQKDDRESAGQQELRVPAQENQRGDRGAKQGHSPAGFEKYVQQAEHAPTCGKQGNQVPDHGEDPKGYKGSHDRWQDIGRMLADKGGHASGRVGIPTEKTVLKQKAPLVCKVQEFHFQGVVEADCGIGAKGEQVYVANGCQQGENPKSPVAGRGPVARGHVWSLFYDRGHGADRAGPLGSSSECGTFTSFNSLY